MGWFVEAVLSLGMSAIGLMVLLAGLHEGRWEMVVAGAVTILAMASYWPFWRGRT